MILATIRMTIPLRKCDNVLKIIKSLIEKTRKDSGCLSVDLYKDLQENNTFLLEEVWRTEEDLHLHIRSEEYRNLLLILEMALTEPEIKFSTISRWTLKNGETNVIPSLIVDERNESTIRAFFLGEIMS
jgi:quinol monooxygenase YgiN